MIVAIVKNPNQLDIELILVNSFSGAGEELPRPRVILLIRVASLCGCQGASGREPREPDAGFAVTMLSLTVKLLILMRISLERR